MSLEKKWGIKKYVLVWYLILSALFIAFSVFNYIKFSVYSVGVQNGATQAVNSVINQALNTKCSSFSVSSWNTEVALINIKCLQQAPIEQAPVETK